MRTDEEKFTRGRVTMREKFSEDLWRFRVDPGEGFKYVAGQYATLGVEKDGKRIERAYSLVSSPYEKELEFFFELVEKGELTPLLFPIEAGMEVMMRRIAKGRFTLDLKSGHHNHLLLATVTGVAPYVSYARTLYADWKENKFPADLHLYVIQGASKPWEFGYREELEKMAAEVPWLTYVPTISRPWEDPSWKGETGRVEDVIRMYVDKWNLNVADTTGYLCGHPQMIELGDGILRRCGFDKNSVRQEVYWIPAKEAQA
jgi:ferredoxin/flavodoxin---NADP+ reductase